jgi:oligopeptide transport system ATP-binding protein
LGEMMGDESVIEVRGLTVRFDMEFGAVRAVRDVSFSMAPGEIVALVGESGSGKSTIGLAMMRLIEQSKRLNIEGEILFRGENGVNVDLMTLPEKEMQKIRGNNIAMIFQEPMSSLNPIFTNGDQVVEAIRTHQEISRADARARALEMFTLLGIPNPEKCLTSYPHQISGGMRQRVMIAMALACNPALLIADEPTTALDVTIQAQIVETLKNLQQRLGMSVLFITHNLGLVAEIADRVLVLYAGQVVELAKVKALFDQPLMPYTKALLQSIPHLGCSNQPDYRIEAIQGNVPSAAAFPSGCAFHPRCRYFVPAVCDASEPGLEDGAVDHLVRCFRWQEIPEGAET